ncbi:MAG: hypothetical protein GXO89_02395 [Chlorobi bacterium]|nr:hypothetical protein [Chlorobiota bacterium]
MNVTVDGFGISNALYGYILVANENEWWDFWESVSQIPNSKGKKGIGVIRNQWEGLVPEREESPYGHGSRCLL